MAKISGVVEEVMNSQNLALRPNAFGDDTVITRLGYSKGEQPDHLESEAIEEGVCEGKTGKVTYKGKKIPATAACVAKNYS